MNSQSCLRRRTARALTLVVLLCALCHPASAMWQPQADNPKSGGPWLMFDLGMQRDVRIVNAGVDFRVDISSDNGTSFTNLFRRAYAGKAWLPCAVNLAPYAGRAVILRLRADSRYGSNGEQAYVGAPRIVSGPLKPWEAYGHDKADIDLQKTFAQADVFLLDKNGARTPVKRTENGVGYDIPGLYNGSVTSKSMGDPNGPAQLAIPIALHVGSSVVLDYKITVPPAGTDAKWTPPAPPALTSAMRDEQILVYSADTEHFEIQKDTVPTADPSRLRLRVASSASADTGYAFAGFLLGAVKRVSAQVTLTGEPKAVGENGFVGFVLDFHTPLGYRKRVYISLKDTGNPAHFDMRPYWNLDDGSLNRVTQVASVAVYTPLAMDTSGRVTVEVAKYAPPDWDGRVWLGVGVQNAGRGVALDARLAGQPYSAHSDAPPFTLKSAQADFAVDRGNGRLIGGRDAATGRAVFQGSIDSYTRETRYDLFPSSERLDRVIGKPVLGLSPEGARTLELRCRNAAYPDLTITKRYALGKSSSTLSKTVTFKTTSPNGYFFRYFTQAALDPKFRAGGFYYRSVYDPITLAKSVTDDTYGGQAYSGGGYFRQVVFTNLKAGLTAAQYVYRVGGRWVMVDSWSDSRQTCWWTPDGWRFDVNADYLKAGGADSSVEIHYSIVKGDQLAFFRQYQNLPEYKKTHNDYPIPNWVQKLDVDISLFNTETGRDAAEFQPYPVVSYWMSLNPPYGDYFSTGQLTNSEPEGIHPSVMANQMAVQFAAAEASRPNVHMGEYTMQWGITDPSVTFKTHPDFLITDRTDGPIYLGFGQDVSGAPVFAKQIGAPGSEKYFLDQYDGLMKNLHQQLVYIDGNPMGEEYEDWKLQKVVHGSAWIDFWRNIRGTIQKVDPEAALFNNGPANPYTDLGYTEIQAYSAISPTWPSLHGWESLANNFLFTKLMERPTYAQTSLHWNAQSEPWYSDYNLAFGLLYCGQSLAQLQQRRGLIEAGHELRDSVLVENAISPKWWRLESPDFEAYTLKVGDAVLAPVIYHGHAPGGHADLAIQIDGRQLGLKKNAPAALWLWEMVDPTGPLDGSKQIDRAFAVKYFGLEAHPTSNFGVTVPGAKELLRTVAVSQVPGYVYSVNDRQAQTLLPETLGVRCRFDNGWLAVTSTQKTAEVIVPEVPTLWRLPKDAKATRTEFGGLPAGVVKVTEGTTRIQLERNP